MNTHRTREISRTGVLPVTTAATIIIAVAFATFIQFGAARVAYAQQGPDDTLHVTGGSAVHLRGLYSAPQKWVRHRAVSDATSGEAHL